jgi:hypothetical protein
VFACLLFVCFCLSAACLLACFWMLGFLISPLHLFSLSPPQGDYPTERKHAQEGIGAKYSVPKLKPKETYDDS